MMSLTSNPFLLIIIFTIFLCLSSSTYGIPTKYSSILGPNLDKLPTQNKTIELFQIWMNDHGRVYKDQEEMTKKFDIFVSNLKYITETNVNRKSSPHGFLLGLTNFADWSPQEFKERMLHNLDMSMINDTMKVNDIPLSSCNAAPSSLDWRLKGAVTNVKDQTADCSKFIVFAWLIMSLNNMNNYKMSRELIFFSPIDIGLKWFYKYLYYVL